MATAGYCPSCETRWYWNKELPIAVFFVPCPTRKCKKTRLVPITRMSRIGESVKPHTAKILWKRGRQVRDTDYEATAPGDILPELAEYMYHSIGTKDVQIGDIIEVVNSEWVFFKFTNS